MSMFVGHKANQQHIQALYDCKLRDDKILDLFRLKLEETKTALVQADEAVRIHRLQGQAAVLQDFLDAVEKSSEILARTKGS